MFLSQLLSGENHKKDHLIVNVLVWEKKKKKTGNSLITVSIEATFPVCKAAPQTLYMH